MRTITAKGRDGITEVLTVTAQGTVQFDGVEIGTVTKFADRVPEMRGSIEVAYSIQIRWVARDEDGAELARCSRMTDAAIAVFRSIEMED